MGAHVECNGERVLFKPRLFAATFSRAQLNNYMKLDSHDEFEKFV